MRQRKNLIARNEGFICEKCNTEVLPAKGTSRNHCPECLTSKHVDHNTPGDRTASCHGLMPTTAIEGVDPDKLDLVQQCQSCGKTQRNRTAPDDNKDRIFDITKAPFAP